MEVALFDLRRAVETIVLLAIAYLLALPVGFERQVQSAVQVGLRTFPIVSVGACAYLLLSRHLHEIGVFDVDGMARALRSVITGIGFIGGGAILKSSRSAKGVAGVATGAGIWTTGAIGASVAHGYYEVAIALSLTSLFVLEVIPRISGWGRPERRGE